VKLRARQLRAWRTASLAFCAAAAGCAGQADHFYALSIIPQASRPPTASFATHVVLNVSIPDTLDRREMVVDEALDRIVVLEHERWAAPLSDLVTQTLARDIEQRRPEVLVAGRDFDQPSLKLVHIKVDLVRMSANRGGSAALEAHWRIIDPSAQADLLGGETLTSPIAGDDYASIARAFSACLASLADRLVAQLPTH
jgi:hypothetical protein